MSDRFDEMRSKGINTNDATATAVDIIQGKTAYVGGQKITGSLVPSGGSGNLNVFVQTTEPTKKDGIWIKESGNYDKVKCIYYNAPIGNTLEPTIVDYLNGLNTNVAKIIVNGYLYYFGINSSFKYDLKTKTKTELNCGAFPNNFQSVCGCAYYKGLVYIFYYNNSLRYLTYDIYTDTFGSEIDTGLTGSSYYFSKPYIYNSSVYVLNYYYSGSNSYRISIFQYDLDNGNKSNVSTSPYYFTRYLEFASFAFVGSYAYCMWLDESHKYIFRINLLTPNGLEVVRNFSSISDFFPFTTINTIYSYAVGKKIFFFYPSLPTQYLTYDVDNDTLEKIVPEYPIITRPVSASTTYRYGEQDPFCLDSENGLLYVINRRYGSNDGSDPIPQGLQTSCIQLTDVGSDLSFADGTAVLYLSTSNRFVKMLDNCSLYTGVQNTYLMKNGELDDNHVAFYGDGERWNVFKNPTNETCTVTFDTAGGSGTYASQTIVRGTTATKPDTDPTKSGYQFGGWLYNNNIFDFGSRISTDTTLVAKWLETFTVTFNDGNGNITTQEVLEGQTATKPATDPTSSTGIFKYWALNGTEFNFNTPITAPITLMAEYDTFTEIECIESTGTQYIDTGFKPNQNTRVVCDLSGFPNTSNAWAFGSRNSSTSGGFAVVATGTNSYRIDYDASKTAVASTYNYTGRFTIDMNKNVYSMSDGTTTYNGSGTSSTFSGSYSIYIFTCNQQTISGIASYALYNFKIYDNGTLVRDFQPIRFTNTGEYCLLDKVENKIYHNAGTGTFISGGAA